MANRANRMVFQIVSGRQVWRGKGVDREYLLFKLREFHRTHGTTLEATVADMNAAFEWLPKATHAEEAKPLAEISDDILRRVAKQLHDWVLRPAATEGYRTAEVTLGGIDTDELSSKTMECKRQPGLYCIGEVVDVTGHLGGFNFQWAWASAQAAGQFV